MPPKKTQAKQASAASAKPALQPAAKKAAGGGGGGGGGGAAAAAASSSKATKESKKLAKTKAEKADQALLNAMMNPPSDDGGSGSEEEEEAERTDEKQDGAGATAATKRDKKLEEEFERRSRQEMIRQREEEREQQRLEKASGKRDKDAALASVLEKVEREGDKKLSNKERRLYAKHLEAKKAEDEENARQQVEDELPDDMKKLHESLKDFTVSMAESTVTDGAVDVRLMGFSITAGSTRLFEDANLVLAKGRRYGFLGPNGQGKTTLLKHLAARRLPLPERMSIGFVEQEARASARPVVEEVLSADTRRTELLAEEKTLLERIETSANKEASEEEVEGDAAATLASLCQRLVVVGDQLEACGADAADAKVRRILCGLGFSTAMAEGPVKDLSGGWRMRVSLAKALFLEPDLLLLDEPTNHLDLDAVLWLDEYLSSYPKTLFIVSHDADFLDSVCTDLVHLEKRSLVQYKGGYSDFLRAHKMRRQTQEKEYQKQQKAGAKVPPEKMVEKPRDYVVQFRFFPPGNDELQGISVNDVAFSYSGQKPWLISDMNFRIDSSIRIVVVGPNGAGKSTLLKLMGKHLEPCKGTVEHSRGLKVGFYSQHFDEIAKSFHLSGVEFLTSSDVRGSGGGAENAQLAHSCLGRFGLPSDAHKRPMAELSGGQKARVCFASITCRRPGVLILDEPTNHLDIESVQALIDALKEYKGGLLMVTHDARLVKELECKVWICRGPGERVSEAASFESYRREILADIQRREAEVEAEAKRLAQLRKSRREETLKRSRASA